MGERTVQREAPKINLLRARTSITAEVFKLIFKYIKNSIRNVRNAWLHVAARVTSSHKDLRS